MSSTAVSAHLLSIEHDYHNVHNSVQSLSADWRKIGVGLGITFNRLRAIESNRKEVDEMLMDMIAAWLEIESETQPEPTWRKLCEAVGKINRGRAEVIAQEHQCDCSDCLAQTRNTPVAREVESYDVVGAARTLKEGFDEMMIFTAKEIRLADTEELRYRINEFVKREREVNETVEGIGNGTIDTHLSRIEDFVAPSAILNYLYRYEFIGYINYALLKVIQKVIRSKLLDKHMEEYEKDYQLFLRCALEDIHAAFKKCPELQPNYPVGLPSFTIHLESDWDGRSMYEWKELFKRWFSWPETLNIVKISENCIIITCTVWPKFAEDVVRDLTDSKVIADLKKEGVTIDISPQLLAYHHHGDFPIAMDKDVLAGAKNQGTLEQTIKGTSSSDADNNSLAEDSTGTIPEVDTLPSLSTDETEPGAKESPLKDQPAEGILLIKPDWDEHVDDASGYVSMKQDSDGQTVTSGDTYTEGRQLVELQDDVNFKEAIDTYEHVVRRLLSERKSAEKKLVSEREMKKKIVMELEQIKGQLNQYLKYKDSSASEELRTDDPILLRLQKVLTNREKTIETMRRDNERLQQSIKDLKIKTQLSYQEQYDLDQRLLEAAKQGSIGDVEKQLSSGAEVNTTGSSWNQRTPLHLASESGHENVVETLVNHGAMIEAKDVYQRTPLYLASESGHQNVVETLVNHGATIEAKDGYQYTPLHLASKSGHQNVVETLVNHGATIEAKDRDQCTPLHLASESGHQNVVETLVNHGAMIEAKDGHQHTPLHLASRSGHQNVVETLVNHGATTEAKDKYQRTPLHLASKNGHQNVVQTLVNHGAMIEAKDVYQCTPLHFARKSGHENVVETLVNHGAMIEAKDGMDLSGRMYGEYMCYLCGREWTSINASKNDGVECRHCYEKAELVVIRPLEYSDIPKDRRLYGKFKCPKCSKTWNSGNSWKGYRQQCKSCKEYAEPYFLNYLEFQGDTRDPEKPHVWDLCEKCQELGYNCRSEVDSDLADADERLKF